MAHPFINENLLTSDDVKILHEADSAPYAFGNYTCLGDLHANVTVEISTKTPTTHYPLPKLTPEKIAKHIHDFYSYLRKMVGKGVDYIEDIDECIRVMRAMLSELVDRFSKEEFERICEEIEYLLTLWYKRDQEKKAPLMLGCYFPQTNKVELYINSIRSVSSYNAAELLAATYAHEMGHAFYADNAKTQNDSWLCYLEEPMAELFSLRFAEVFDKTHAVFLKNTQDDIKSKKWDAAVCYYGFGAAVYQSGLITPEMYHNSVARPFLLTNEIMWYIQPFMDGFYPFVEEKIYVEMLKRILLMVPSVSQLPASASAGGNISSASQSTTSISAGGSVSSGMYNTIIDNRNGNTMAECIKSILRDPACTEIKIATQELSLPGMNHIFPELRSFIGRGGKMELLIAQFSSPSDLQSCDVSYIDENGHTCHQRTDCSELAQWLHDYGILHKSKDGNIQVRMINPKGLYSYLPANCYIFLGNGLAKAIIGSSSFTWEELCSVPQMNYLETDPLKVTTLQNNYTPILSHLSWFQEWWDACVDWTRKFFKLFDSFKVQSPKKNNHLPLISPIGIGNTSRSRMQSSPFEVIFPDGTVVSGQYAVQVFIDSLQKIGLNRVQALRIEAVKGYNVVSDTARPPQGNTQTWQDYVGGKYIYTKLGNDRKKELLRQVADKLGIAITIENT